MHRAIFVPDASQRAFRLAVGRGRRWRACFFNNLQEVWNKAFRVLPLCVSTRVSMCVCAFHADELCDSMTVGRLYRVIGFPATHANPLQSVSWSVEANGVQPLLPDCEARHNQRLPPAELLYQTLKQIVDPLQQGRSVPQCKPPLQILLRSAPASSGS